MDQRIGRQGGWVGLIGMLLALAIVAWLYGDALKPYLLPPSPPTAAINTGTPGAAARAAGGIAPVDIDVSWKRRPHRRRSGGRAVSRAWSRGEPNSRRNKSTTPYAS